MGLKFSLSVLSPFLNVGGTSVYFNGVVKNELGNTLLKSWKM